jgi:hypothetical protein
LETGIDVSPSRALEAFCMWEQTCARLTRDILAVLVVIRPRWAATVGGCDRGCECLKQSAVLGASVSAAMLEAAPRSNCAWCRRWMLDAANFWIGSEVRKSRVDRFCHSVELGPAPTKLPLTGGRFEDDTNRRLRSCWSKLYYAYLTASRLIYAFDLLILLLEC